MIKRFKRWIARGVMYQWRKMSLYSALAWAWLMRNGNGNHKPEMLDRYLDEDGE